jgi:hypothetical protein
MNIAIYVKNLAQRYIGEKKILFNTEFNSFNDLKQLITEICCGKNIYLFSFEPISGSSI